LLQGDRYETQPPPSHPAHRSRRRRTPLRATLRQAQISIGIGIHIGIAPPALPVYVQPPIPGDGYIWTPGYWAYGDAGYFWVPGTWVLAPEPGYLWTPGYWGLKAATTGWHEGYWGPHIGYYGGINYGFGYGGIGFAGGEWRGNHFFYNSAVVNFNGGWHPDHDRIYVDREVVVHNTIVNVNHVSYNGPGGIDRRPSPTKFASPMSATFNPPRSRCSTRTSLPRTAPSSPPSTTAAPRPWPQRTLPPTTRSPSSTQPSQPYLGRRPLCREILQPQQPRS
jgi:hypothetical protein